MGRQGRISTKVFWGSRPGEEAPSLSSNVVTLAQQTVIRLFWLRLIIPKGTNGGDGNQQLVLWGFYMVGEEETGTVCIAKTKHMAGQSGMVWSVRFLDIFLFISCFFPLDCIMFPIPSSSLKRERVGWEEIPLMSGHVFLLVTWFTFNLYMSLFARALPHHLALGRLCLSTSGGE